MRVLHRFAGSQSPAYVIYFMALSCIRAYNSSQDSDR